MGAAGKVAPEARGLTIDEAQVKEREAMVRTLPYCCDEL